MKRWPLSQSVRNFKSSLMHRNTMVVEGMQCYHATYLEAHGGAQPNAENICVTIVSVFPNRITATWKKKKK
jgi:hypothetical protein